MSDNKFKVNLSHISLRLILVMESSSYFVTFDFRFKWFKRPHNKIKLFYLWFGNFYAREDASHEEIKRLQVNLQSH